MFSDIECELDCETRLERLKQSNVDFLGSFREKNQITEWGTGSSVSPIKPPTLIFVFTTLLQSVVFLSKHTEYSLIMDHLNVFDNYGGAEKDSNLTTQ